MIYSHEVEQMCTVAQGCKTMELPQFLKKQNG